MGPMTRTSRGFRVAWFVLALSLVDVGCTPGTPEADSLPASELPTPQTFHYRAEPDALPPAPAPPEPEPEVQDEDAEGEPYDPPPARLLAAGPSGVWAASDRSRLWIGSLDEGSATSVERGSTRSIRAIDVDREGSVWIVESGGRLLEAGLDKAPRERGQIPFDSVSALQVRGEWFVALGHAGDSDEGQPRELALSHEGRDWTRYPTPDDGNMHDDLSVGAEGLIQLLDGQEAGCGGGYQERWIAQLDPVELAAGTLTWTSVDWPFDAAFDRHVGAGGWAFAHDECAEELDDELCAVDRSGAIQRLAPFAGRYVLEHAHGHTLLLTNEGLSEVVVRPEGGLRVERLSADESGLLDASITASTSDGAGHLLVLVGDRLHVGGASWQVIALADARVGQ